MTGFIHHFSWDPEKALVNHNKHGVNFEVAATVLNDSLALSRYDEEHSEAEERWVTLGLAADGALLVVVHTFEELNPHEAAVRIISARPATPAERRDYENPVG
jgi:uncharacterized DUF497 family protein